jgi:hypothetical protein
MGRHADVTEEMTMNRIHIPNDVAFIVGYLLVSVGISVCFGVILGQSAAMLVCSVLTIVAGILLCMEGLGYIETG